MAATGYTPISLYYSTTVSAVPTAGNLVAGELAININDGKLYFKNSSNVVTLLASSSGASGDVVGPASATANGVALFDGTTGKLIKNSSSFVQDATGVGIGTTSPFTPLDVNGYSSFGVRNTTAYSTTIATHYFGSSPSDLLRNNVALNINVDATTSPRLRIYKSRGSSASPTAVSSGDFLGDIQYYGHDGTTYIYGGGVAMVANATPSTNNLSTVLSFLTNNASATANERMRIDNAGNVGIGTSSPGNTLQVSGTSYTTGKTYIGNNTNFTNVGNLGWSPAFIVEDTNGQGIATVRNTADAYGGTINLVKSRGTLASPSAVTSGDRLGQIYFNGYDSVDYSNTGASIEAIANATWTSNSCPSDLVFSTTVSGSFVASERMRIDSSGNVGIGTSSPSAQLQVTGSSSVSALKVPNIEEVATVSATAATGTINYDITTQSVLYYTSNASANWTVNFRGSSGTSLNTLMQTGESISVSFLVTQGSTAYYNSSVQVDGTTSGVTTRWQGGTAPTSGNASSIDSYTYVIIKTGSATFTVLASQTRFA